MPLALRFTGKLNKEALGQALKLITERHESLRTLITESDSGHPIGLLSEGPHFKDLLRVIDLKDEYQAHQHQIHDITNRLIREEASTPFNLSNDIPFRATLLELTSVEHILMLTMHHHAGDGSSWSIIAQELKIAYAAFNRNSLPDFSRTSDSI